MNLATDKQPTLNTQPMHFTPPSTSPGYGHRPPASGDADVADPERRGP
ncbi:hypothetical protein FOMA001_g12014 [Fusarium oxysporum f. sp. matthiolae]|nr:hypothetical protein FOMA001_g12014 [Fusarium oxysporum f. sp. matthiolae]